MQDLLSDYEYELKLQYLLYRNAALQEVNGIWLYNQQDCEAAGNLFGREAFHSASRPSTHVMNYSLQG